MAHYEDFDSDIDEDICKEYIPLPYSPSDKSSENAEITQNLGPLAQSFNYKYSKESETIYWKTDSLLSDHSRQQLLLEIQEMWNIYGNRNGVVRNVIQQLYNGSGDPYLSAVYVMFHSHDFLKSSPRSLGTYVMDQFECWLEEYKNLKGNYPQLHIDTIVVGISTVAKQKNTKLISKVIQLYRGVENKNELEHLVHYLIKKKSYATACRMATSLEMYFSFTLEDFILPLVLQDKLNLAEEFLIHNSPMQRELITFLDQHVRQPRDMYGAVSHLNIPDMKLDRLNSRNMTKLITRLARRFGINAELCPETSNRHRLGGLRYLLHRKYRDNSMGNENWEELVHLAVAHSTDLQEELVVLVFQYGDSDTAARFAYRYKIHPSKLPDAIVDLVRKLETTDQHPITTKNAVLENWEEEINALQYHTLKLPLDCIIHVDTWENLEKSLLEISKSDIVGFDVEWQPTFGAQSTRAALVQIATRNKIFLVDITALREVEKLNATQGHFFFQTFFANSNVLKLGYSFREDLHVLSRSLPGLENINKAKNKWLDLHNLWNVIQQKYQYLIDELAPSTDNSKGLSELIRQCFGRPLNKQEQFSDWERRPLRSTQITYAALDAYCLIEVYDFLTERARINGVSLSEIFHDAATPVQQPTIPIGRGRGRGKMIATSSSSPPKPKVPFHQSAVSPSEVRFVCDRMVGRLGKLLRSCGIDTVWITEADYHDECVHIARRENRFILSRGSVAQRLCQHVPVGHCLEIWSDNPEEQLLEVIQFYNIAIEEKHIFTRCQVCNSNTFHHVDRNALLQLRKGGIIGEYTQKEAPKSGQSRSWVLLDEPVDVQYGTTSAGIKIQYAAIPEGVLTSYESFYICNFCGKCYWDGSHLRKILRGSLKLVMNG